MQGTGHTEEGLLEAEYVSEIGPDLLTSKLTFLGVVHVRNRCYRRCGRYGIVVSGAVYFCQCFLIAVKDNEKPYA
jgi:hypothetical protein